MNARLLYLLALSIVAFTNQVQAAETATEAPPQETAKQPSPPDTQSQDEPTTKDLDKRVAKLESKPSLAESVRVEAAETAIRTVVGVPIKLVISDIYAKGKQAVSTACKQSKREKKIKPNHYPAQAFADVFYPRFVSYVFTSGARMTPQTYALFYEALIDTLDNAECDYRTHPFEILGGTLTRFCDRYLTALKSISKGGKTLVIPSVERMIRSLKTGSYLVICDRKALTELKSRLQEPDSAQINIAAVIVKQQQAQQRYAAQA